MNAALLICSAWQPQSAVRGRLYAVIGTQHMADSTTGPVGHALTLAGPKERHYSLTRSRRSVR